MDFELKDNTYTSNLAYGQIFIKNNRVCLRCDENNYCYLDEGILIDCDNNTYDRIINCKLVEI